MNHKSNLKRQAILALAISAVVNSPSHALTIVPTYTSGVTSLFHASEFEAAFNYAALQYEQMYSNPITINITVGTETTGLGNSSSPATNTVSYATMRNDLIANETTSDQSTNIANNWPTTDPTGSKSTWTGTSAEDKALGINSGNTSGSDGTFLFNINTTYTLDPYDRSVSGDTDFIGVAEHEISEIMGRVPGFGAPNTAGNPNYQPYDLTHYNGVGVRDFNGTKTGDYFSIDGGATNLKSYNYAAGGDLTDWLSPQFYPDPTYVPDSFNAFSAPDNTNALTPVDAEVMDILGYNRTSQNLTFKAGTFDFLTGGNWTSSNSSSLNPFHGAAMLINSSSATAFHSFAASENFTLASNSDMGQAIEVRAGFLEFNDPSQVTGPGFGMFVNQDGAILVDGSGSLYAQCPISVGDAPGVTNALAEFFGNAVVDIANPAQTVAFIVGNSGSGTVTQTGNAHVQTPELYVGDNTYGNAQEGSGNYLLNTTSTLAVSGDEIIGDVGATGLFQLVAGTNTVTGNLIIGANEGASGTFDMSGGTLNAGFTHLIEGHFNQSGGNFTTPTIQIDQLSSYTFSNGSTFANVISDGNFTLSGGLLLGNFQNGNQFNTASFTYSSGSFIGSFTNEQQATLNLEASFTIPYSMLNEAPVTIPSGITLTVNGSGINNQSTLTLTGGTLAGSGSKYNYGLINSTGTISGSGELLNDGTINVSGGAISLSNTLIDGYAATGIINHTNGVATINASDAVVIGDLAGSNGTYTQSASSLTANGNEFIGDAGTGTYNLQAGLNAVSNGGFFIIAGTAAGIGNYNISGTGLLQVGTSEYIGDFGNGTLTQTGGGNGIAPGGSLILGNVSLSTGSYNLSSGSLTLSSGAEIVGSSGNGSFNQTGGSHYIGGNLDIASTSTSVGTFSLSGTGLLEVIGSITVGDSGNGSFTQSGGQSSASGLTVGSASASTGGFELDDGTMTLSGAEIVGSYGSATFTQTGGDNVINSTDALAVGLQASSNGTYNLQGGALNAGGHEFIGDLGTGTFNQTGGTNTISSGHYLIVAAVANSTGTYNLSDPGIINVSDDEAIGDYGTGTFNQMGGTNNLNLGYSIDIGNVANSNGAYNLSGGDANISGSVYVGGSSSGAGGAGQLNVSQTGNLTIQGSLTIYNEPSNIVNFTGGTISTPTLNFNGNPALFQWTGGTLNINDSVTWDPSAAPTTTSAAFGPSLTLGSGQALQIYGDETLGSGTAFTLAVSAGASHLVTGTMTVSPNGYFQGQGGLTAGPVNNNGSFSQVGTFNAQGDFTNNGSAIIGGTQIWSPGTNLNNQSGTTLLVSDAGSDLTSPLSVNITGGIVTLASAQHLAGLSITGPGQFDIANYHVIINYGTGVDPIASIAALIASGYAGGTWSGSGIMSSMAQTNSASYGIGYADSADPGNPAGLASGQIEIKYTLLGDANLDGAVNGSDFAILASNFNKAVSGWDQGDFNYDGAANGADFAALAANFNKGASLSSVDSADMAKLDSFAAANGLMADVPEPATAALMVVAGLGILHRRRRSANLPTDLWINGWGGIPCRQGQKLGADYASLTEGRQDLGYDGRGIETLF